MIETFKSIVDQINESTSTREQQWKIYKKCPYSVSKIVASLHKEFDTEKMAEKTFEKHFDDPDSKYYKMSVEEIINQWEEKSKQGRENGKALDDFIGMILDPKANDSDFSEYIGSLNSIAANKCKKFKEFFESNLKDNLNFVGRELMLYDESARVNGRLDALFEKNGNLFLIDWKNNETITKENKWEKCKGPLYKYDACDLNLYTVQVYIYVYILRKIYGLTNVNIIPLIIRIGETDFEICSPQIPYSDQLVNDIIKFATMQINKKSKQKK